MKVEVLGIGCANGKRTIQLIEETAREIGLAIELAKVEDLQKIMTYGVMSTPAVVVDGKVVHAGGMPTRDKVQRWLAGAAAAPAASAAPRCCG
jgi:small redox-active disulfide protein 2